MGRKQCYIEWSLGNESFILKEKSMLMHSVQVKADQEFSNQQKVQIKEKTTEFEKNKEPELDEM